jgi:hypothetical protein
MAQPVALMGMEMRQHIDGATSLLVTEKLCKGCGKIKARSEFYEHQTSADRLQQKCIDCMKSIKTSNPRPPLSSSQIALLISMLDLLPDTVKDTSWIEEERMRNLNPGLKNVGRLINRDIVERKVLHKPAKGAQGYIYRLTEDGRTIAKGMEALTRKAG